MSRTELQNLIDKVAKKLAYVNMHFMYHYRFGTDICMTRERQYALFLYYWILLNYDVNEDGSTNGQYNYITEIEFNTVIQKIKKALLW